MPVVLNKALIEAGRTGNSGYRKKQLLALGVNFPPKSGWIERLIGTEVSDEQYERFLGHSTSKQAEQILRASIIQSERRSLLLSNRPPLISIMSTCRRSTSILPEIPRLLIAEDLLDTIGEIC